MVVAADFVFAAAAAAAFDTTGDFWGDAGVDFLEETEDGAGLLTDSADADGFAGAAFFADAFTLAGDGTFADAGAGVLAGFADDFGEAPLFALLGAGFDLVFAGARFAVGLPVSFTVAFVRAAPGRDATGLPRAPPFPPAGALAFRPLVLSTDFVAILPL